MKNHEMTNEHTQVMNDHYIHDYNIFSSNGCKPPHRSAPNGCKHPEQGHVSM